MLVKYPDPILKQTCEPITPDDDIRFIVDRMAEVMYLNGGIGLAAPQAGINKRIFIIDITKKGNGLVVFCNPEVHDTEGTVTEYEGCLSFPGIVGRVPRPKRVQGHALDIFGNRFEFDHTMNLMNVAISHENDHLNGILMTDLMNRSSRRAFLKSLSKSKNG